MKHAPDVRYFLEKCIRRGTAAYSGIHEVGERYGTDHADVLAEELSAAGVRLVDEKDIDLNAEQMIIDDFIIAGCNASKR